MENSLNAEVSSISPFFIFHASIESLQAHEMRPYKLWSVESVVYRLPNTKHPESIHSYSSPKHCAIQQFFSIRFVHTFSFVSHACSSGIPLGSMPIFTVEVDITTTVAVNKYGNTFDLTWIYQRTRSNSPRPHNELIIEAATVGRSWWLNSEVEPIYSISHYCPCVCVHHSRTARMPSIGFPRSVWVSLCSHRMHTLSGPLRFHFVHS